MGVESAADRLAFANPDEFGRIASYTPQGGIAAEIAVLRDLPFRAAFSDPGLGTSAPSVLVADENLPAGAAEGDEIEVAGVIYAIRGIEADGTGMSRLRLEEIEP